MYLQKRSKVVIQQVSDDIYFRPTFFLTRLRYLTLFFFCGASSVIGSWLMRSGALPQRSVEVGGFRPAGHGASLTYLEF